MKLRDIESYLEQQNKLNEFLKNGKEMKVIVTGDCGSMVIADNVKELIDIFTNMNYGDLTEDTELENDDGYIEFRVIWKNFKGIEEQAYYYLWLEEKEVD